MGKIWVQRDGFFFGVQGFRGFIWAFGGFGGLAFWVWGYGGFGGCWGFRVLGCLGPDSGLLRPMSRLPKQGFSVVFGCLVQGREFRG